MSNTVKLEIDALSRKFDQTPGLASVKESIMSSVKQIISKIQPAKDEGSSSDSMRELQAEVRPFSLSIDIICLSRLIGAIVEA